MKFNRTVMKSLAFAVALGSVSFLGYHSAKAAAPTLTFDGVGAKLTANDGKRYWGIAKKLKAAPKKRNAQHANIGGAWYQIKRVEFMVGNEIDLSKYKGKAVIVAVGESQELSATNDVNWAVKEIPAGMKKFKVSSDDLATIKLFDGTKKLDLTDDEKIEVRVGSGDWQKAEEYFGNDFGEAGKKLAILNQRGANLTLRYEGTADAWGSNEAKLKVAAQKKGPNVKFDVVKDTSNVKKGILFQTIDEDASLGENFEAAPEKAKLSQVGIKNTNDVAGKKTQFIYFKEAGKGKKAPSRLSKVVVKKTPIPTIKPSLTEITKQGSDIIVNEVAINLAVGYDVSKGGLITNKSTDNDYEVAIAYSEDDAEDTLKWLKLKKTKNEDKPTTIKVAASKTAKANTFNPDANAAKVSKIYVRKAGKKQEGNVVTMPSPAISAKIKMAKIDQKISITTPNGTDFKHTDVDGKIKLKVTASTEASFAIAAKVTNPVKVSGKPKLSVTGALSGVDVKVSELTEGTDSATFEITIKVAKTALTAPDGSQKVTFKLEYEGAEKVYEASFNTSI